MREYFENGYGVSVVRDVYTYGGKEGLFELAVTAHEKDEEGKTVTHICYDTPITDDVIGYLTEEQVKEITEQVKALPKRETPAKNEKVRFSQI